MLVTLNTFALDGLTARPVRVEVAVHRGLPSFTIIGLPDSAAREARERIRAALVNSGLEFPLQRIVVNLSPARGPMSTPALDLPIAVALLSASGQLELGELRSAAFVGELALDGSTRPITGALAIAEAAREDAMSSIVLPAQSSSEAALVNDLDILPLDAVEQLPRISSGEFKPARPDAMSLALDPPAGTPDLADFRGQPELRRALEISAAGGHSLLMVGPRGAGKSLAASRLPSILPPLLPTEALEVARVASAAGRLNHVSGSRGRPFRAPHHTISASSLVGGGTSLHIGEATLAHCGVLFLDEVAEFRRDALEALTEPLQQGSVTITRGGRERVFPAQFILVAAADPCPCGRGPDDPDCPCNPHEFARLRVKVAASLGEEIGIGVCLRQPTFAEIGGPPGESSAVVADRVVRARELQERRLGPGRCNAQMTREEVRSCPLHDDGALLLGDLYTQQRVSALAHDRALRVAQTLADLEEAPAIEDRHLTESLRLHPSLVASVHP